MNFSKGPFFTLRPNRQKIWRILPPQRLENSIIKHFPIRVFYNRVFEKFGCFIRVREHLTWFSERNLVFYNRIYMHVHSRDKSLSLNFCFIIGYPPYMYFSGNVGRCDTTCDTMHHKMNIWFFYAWYDYLSFPVTMTSFQKNSKKY